MQASTGDISANENRDLAFLEIHEHPQAFILWNIARDRSGPDAIGLKIRLYPLGFALHVDEHHDARIAHFSNQANEQWHFIFVRREENRLTDFVYRDLVRLDTYELGLVHVLVREFHNAL